TLPANYVVTNTNDTGAGSLNKAILDANAHAGADLITFNIPGGGVHFILPTSPLPAITETVCIDGTTQPGFATQPLVQLDGLLSPEPFALQLIGGSSIVRGLIISGYDIGITVFSSGNVI